jgi:ribonuclease P protein component
MNRLLRRRDFLAAAKGHFVPQGGVLLQGLDRRDQGAPRLGFTCTKKLGNAVVRNRIRRRIKEAARLVMAGAAQPGFDYVLIGRASAEGRAFEALKKDIISAVSKLHATAPAVRAASQAKD